MLHPDDFPDAHAATPPAGKADGNGCHPGGPVAWCTPPAGERRATSSRSWAVAHTRALTWAVVIVGLAGFWGCVLRTLGSRP